MVITSYVTSCLWAALEVFPLSWVPETDGRSYRPWLGGDLGIPVVRSSFGQSPLQHAPWGPMPTCSARPRGRAGWWWAWWARRVSKGCRATWPYTVAWVWVWSGGQVPNPKSFIWSTECTSSSFVPGALGRRVQPQRSLLSLSHCSPRITLIIQAASSRNECFINSVKLSPRLSGRAAACCGSSSAWAQGFAGGPLRLDPVHLPCK